MVETGVHEHDGRGEVAGEGENDDGNQHDGDLVLLLARRSIADVGHDVALFLASVHGDDEERVEDAQHRDRDHDERNCREPVESLRKINFVNQSPRG